MHSLFLLRGKATSGPHGARSISNAVDREVSWFFKELGATHRWLD